MTLRVSILLPVYNAAATLALCLRSIVRQREARWQCVIVDDGSQDETLQIADGFATDDPRFNIVRRPHEGLVAALNAGLESCRGEYVARMDGDDVMHRRRLELQCAALDEQPELAAVGSHVRLFPRSALQQGFLAYERWLNAIVSPDELVREAFIECPIAHPTLTIRTAVLKAYCYRDEGWPEDYDLILRLLSDGRRLAVVPHRLLHWRDGPSRMSRTHEAYSTPQFTACRAAFLATGFLSAGADYVLWGYGATGKALRKALNDHGKTPAAIVDLHPGRLGQRIFGSPVIPPSDLSDYPLPLVVSVAGLTARGQIRAELSRIGLSELDDYVVCA